jgi:trigger factor
LFEDKVVDFIAELATINERKVDKEALFADPEDEPAKA